ncbi:twin-arginine protein translocation system subunit TatC [Candidatus Thiomargarita nelsonii]|uniref:Sec-independent protein translocase protein TatC n=1 Tax=Candidatus Thiomargarita nelsonii TaxID=1003181 RepID=A0A4E0R0I8_9GAMM|nr:twin-arginine protein translocation system subunit TatC [Candidatus Thiomargarita nelsonii]
MTSPIGNDMPFVQHLLELRTRLLIMILTVVLILLVLMPFASDLFNLLAEPLLHLMPDGTQMIAIDVASPFFIPFKLTLMLSIFLAMPVIFYQLWGFIAPGLYQHEKSMIFPLLVASTLLFYLGMMFAYYVVFPLVFGFMINMTPDGVEMMTDISRYLDFVLKLLFAFGMAFQVPIATIVLVRMGIVTPEALADKRPHIIVAAFVIGMLMTPPDMISQTLLAVPIWLLFEVGLFLSRRVPVKKTEPKDKENPPALTQDEMDAEIARIEDEDTKK